MTKNTIRPEEITSALEQAFSDFAIDSNLEQVGTVLQVGDGVVRVYGLTQVQAGELVVFENGVKALVLNLEEDTIGAIVLGEDRSIKEGDIVRRTGKISALQVGEGMLGRVIDPLGNPIDGKGPIQGETFEMPIERNAPGVIYRDPVSQPLQTGIKAIDAMIPIGRGQRELIIGDRRTGKTTIALDTIINQRRLFEEGMPMYCVYVAIGQKASTIAYVKTILEEYKAMEYTTIVAASASTPAPLQFLAPFSGTAIGEFFEYRGQHALVVYDDLSKQATAYRQICLLLRRPPGREAYPGDIFYLHARLLERASKINRTDSIAEKTNDLPPSLKGKIKGGGSLTALPIIETQAGDVSAYIPTNVISITDGQIFLEKNLFNAGIRPAINVGISVSRVGGSAQIAPMKKIAGKLKLDQAQFLELEAFAKFGADLDPATQLTISRGRKNQEILKQTLHQPMPVAHQIAIIYASTKGYLDEVPLDKVREFEKKYLALLMKKYAGVLENITKGVLGKAEESVLVQVANELADVYCTQPTSK